MATEAAIITISIRLKLCSERAVPIANEISACMDEMAGALDVIPNKIGVPKPIILCVIIDFRFLQSIDAFKPALKPMAPIMRAVEFMFSRLLCSSTLFFNSRNDTTVSAISIFVRSFSKQSDFDT